MLPWDEADGDCTHHQTETIILDSSSPHYAKTVCTDCGKFLGFEKKPKNGTKRTDNNDHWRHMHLERGELQCKICGIRESDVPITFHVHHWLPLSEGGVDEFENTDMLCVYCHEALHVQRKRMAHFMSYMREVMQ